MTHYRPSRTPDRSHEKITNRGGRLRYFLRGAKWVAQFIPFLGSKKMPSTSAREIPNVDFRLIPTELHGAWVVLRMGATQEIIGSGATARQALASCKPSPVDVLTEVPVLEVVTYINMPEDT